MSEKLKLIKVNASAGSGKTHKITLEYLKILFNYWKNKEDFANKILALTFTNKAKAEMQKRVIEYLKELGFKGVNVDNKLNEIVDFLKNKNFSNEEIIEASNCILDNIIDNPENFDISTIDSFIVSLSKFLSYKIDIPRDFKIVLNDNGYLDDTISEIIYVSTYDKEVNTTIDEFIKNYLYTQQTIEWDPISHIRKKIAQIWEEENKCGKEMNVVENLNFKEKILLIKEKVKKLHEILSTDKNINMNKKYMLMEKLENFINDGSPSILAKVIDKNFEHNSLLNKNSKIPEPECINLWNEIKKDLKEYVEELSIANVRIYTKIYSMFIERLNKTMTQEKNILLDYLKRKYVKLSHIDFCKTYLHFIIDEFQDTSYVQWKILKAIVDEKTTKSFLMVGDKKQAIYRWRGGRADLFEYVSHELGDISEETYNLNENYRSGEYIVETINEIFDEKNIETWITTRSEGFKNKNLEFIKNVLNIYKDANQKFSDIYQKKGYVQIEIINKENNDEEILKEKFLTTIDDLRKSWNDNDICILVRTNEEVKIIVKWLTEKYRIPIDTVSTTNIANNPYIKELVYLLKFIANPNDDFSFLNFITGQIFYKKTKIEKEEIFKYIENLNDTSKLYDKFKKFPNNGFKFDEFDEFINNKCNFYDLLINIYHKFEIFSNFKEHTACFLHLLEIANKEELKIQTIQKFLYYFENFDDVFTIKFSDLVNAMHVMTIHKAKGLEFNVVVLPFEKVDVKLGNIFIDDNNEQKGLKLYYIKKDYLNFSDKLSEIYYKEYVKSCIDEINNLYVAMTRAKQELYIFIPEGNKHNDLIDLIFKDSKERIIKKGEKKIKKEENKDGEKKYKITEISDIKIIPKDLSKIYPIEERKIYESKKMGILIHKVLENIKSIDEFDSEKIKEIILREYKNLNEIENIIKLVKNIIEEKEIKKFFTLNKGDIVYTEKEIVDKHGEKYMIDRIIERENEIQLIDFKTGKITKEKENEYKEQIRKYKNLLSSIYEKNINCYLIYLDEKKIVNVNE